MQHTHRRPSIILKALERYFARNEEKLTRLFGAHARHTRVVLKETELSEEIARAYARDQQFMAIRISAAAAA